MNNNNNVNSYYIKRFLNLQEKLKVIKRMTDQIHVLTNSKLQ